VADPRKREAAIAAAEQSCPRCGAHRDLHQEYCLECGLRLPAVAGGKVTSLRRGWLRRFGWYPGDWVWTSLLTLMVAAAGGAAAIALTRESSANSGTTVILTSGIAVKVPSSRQTPFGTATRSGPPEPGAGNTATQPPSTGAPGRTVWPEVRSGWTIVLISYPVGRGPEAPAATALRAARAGLPEVGVLESSDFSSLHPGYYVVFSGVYSSRADADAALASARATGFGGAYVREASR
jgi:hypothetical protein